MAAASIFHSECQVRYIMQCLRELLETGAASMEVRQEPHDRFNEYLDATHAKMVWAHRGVGNWYKNKHGRVVTNSPFRLVDYRAMTETTRPQRVCDGVKGDASRLSLRAAAGAELRRSPDRRV